MNSEKDLKDPGRKLDVSFLEIFKKHRLLVIASALTLLVVVGTLSAIAILANRTAPETDLVQPITTDTVPPNVDAADMVEVLPQMQRSNEESGEGATSTFQQIMDPFAEPMRLTGVVIGGRGGTMAIIESSGSSFIVAAGDYVDDLWAVQSITRGMAVLRARNQEVILYLDRPPVTRSLDQDRDENGS